jgi:hypothetical protein
MLTLAHKCSQMLTHVIGAPLPEPNSTIVLYYYSKDFPCVESFAEYLGKIWPLNGI